MRSFFILLGLTLNNIAIPVWGVWWLYSVIVLQTEFWSTLGLAIMWSVVQAAIGIIMAKISGFTE